jgi:biopolymer transport protein ExbD
MFRTHSIKKLSAYRPRRHAINWLNPVPLIDVVFLLLIFFMLSANFSGREGFLPAMLPKLETAGQVRELEPILIYLNSLPDGGCEVQIGRVESFIVQPGPGQSDFQALGERVSLILDRQGRKTDDPIKLVPNWHTRWDDVAKAYDALYHINLSNIIFTVVEKPD